MSGAGPAAAEAFVRAHTRVAAVPYVPQIRLHLAADPIVLWERTERALDRRGLPPPFWAFAWAGGLALARYLIDHPGVVRGRTVLDLAAGSGLVAVAAARAGAAAVTAVDVDPFAIAAIALNATANGVAVTALLADLLDLPGADGIGGTGGAGAQVVVAGDVFFERSMAERVLPFLERAARRGAKVLVGDPDRAYLPRDRLRAVARYRVPVSRELEDADSKLSTVWRVAAPPGPRRFPP